MTTKVKRPAVLTRTAVPRTTDGSRRTVFGSGEEVAHRWANQLTREARAGNVFCDDGVIFSYGRHFPIARWVRVKGRNEVVFFTTETSSVTTAKHKTWVRRAIPGGATVFTVADVLANTRDHHLTNLKDYQERALKKLEGARRSRHYKDVLIADYQGLIREGNRYAEAVGLRQRIGPPAGVETAEWMGQLEREAAAAAEKEKAALERARKKEAERKAAAMTEWQEKVKEWQAGGDWPGHNPDQLSGLAFLRVKGNVLETSRRVAVPVKAALPLLAAVRGERELPPDFGVDGFRVRQIDRERKFVEIGCHVIEFAEIERVAATIGK